MTTSLAGVGEMISVVTFTGHDIDRSLGIDHPAHNAKLKDNKSCNARAPARAMLSSRDPSHCNFKRSANGIAAQTFNTPLLHELSLP